MKSPIQLLDTNHRDKQIICLHNTDVHNRDRRFYKYKQLFNQLRVCSAKLTKFPMSLQKVDCKAGQTCEATKVQCGDAECPWTVGCQSKFVLHQTVPWFVTSIYYARFFGYANPLKVSPCRNILVCELCLCKKVIGLV